MPRSATPYPVRHPAGSQYLPLGPSNTPIDEQWILRQTPHSQYSPPAKYFLYIDHEAAFGFGNSFGCFRNTEDGHRYESMFQFFMMQLHRRRAEKCRGEPATFLYITRIPKLKTYGDSLLGVRFRQYNALRKARLPLTADAICQILQGQRVRPWPTRNPENKTEELDWVEAEGDLKWEEAEIEWDDKHTQGWMLMLVEYTDSALSENTETAAEPSDSKTNFPRSDESSSAASTSVCGMSAKKWLKRLCSTYASRPNQFVELAVNGSNTLAAEDTVAWKPLLRMAESSALRTLLYWYSRDPQAVSAPMPGFGVANEDSVLNADKMFTLRLALGHWMRTDPQQSLWDMQPDLACSLFMLDWLCPLDYDHANPDTLLAALTQAMEEYVAITDGSGGLWRTGILDITNDWAQLSAWEERQLQSATRPFPAVHTINWNAQHCHPNDYCKFIFFHIQPLPPSANDPAFVEFSQLFAALGMSDAEIRHSFHVMAHGTQRMPSALEAFMVYYQKLSREASASTGLQSERSARRSRIYEDMIQHLLTVLSRSHIGSTEVDDKGLAVRGMVAFAEAYLAKHTSFAGIGHKMDLRFGGIDPAFECAARSVEAMHLCATLSSSHNISLALQHLNWTRFQNTAGDTSCDNLLIVFAGPQATEKSHVQTMTLYITEPDKSVWEVSRLTSHAFSSLTTHHGLSMTLDEAPPTMFGIDPNRSQLRDLVAVLTGVNCPQGSDAVSYSKAWYSKRIHVTTMPNLPKDANANIMRRETTDHSAIVYGVIAVNTNSPVAFMPEPIQDRAAIFRFPKKPEAAKFRSIRDAFQARQAAKTDPAAIAATERCQAEYQPVSVLMMMYNLHVAAEALQGPSCRTALAFLEKALECLEARGGMRCTSIRKTVLVRRLAVSIVLESALRLTYGWSIGGPDPTKRASWDMRPVDLLMVCNPAVMLQAAELSQSYADPVVNWVCAQLRKWFAPIIKKLSTAGRNGVGFTPHSVKFVHIGGRRYQAEMKKGSNYIDILEYFPAANYNQNSLDLQTDRFRCLADAVSGSVRVWSRMDVVGACVQMTQLHLEALGAERDTDTAAMKVPATAGERTLSVHVALLLYMDVDNLYYAMRDSYPPSMAAEPFLRGISRLDALGEVKSQQEFKSLQSRYYELQPALLTSEITSWKGEDRSQHLEAVRGHLSRLRADFVKSRRLPNASLGRPRRRDKKRFRRYRARYLSQLDEQMPALLQGLDEKTDAWKQYQTEFPEYWEQNDSSAEPEEGDADDSDDNEEPDANDDGEDVNMIRNAAGKASRLQNLTGRSQHMLKNPRFVSDHEASKHQSMGLRPQHLEIDEAAATEELPLDQLYRHEIAERLRAFDIEESKFANHYSQPENKALLVYAIRRMCHQAQLYDQRQSCPLRALVFHRSTPARLVEGLADAFEFYASLVNTFHLYRLTHALADAVSDAWLRYWICEHCELRTTFRPPTAPSQISDEVSILSQQLRKTIAAPLYGNRKECLEREYDNARRAAAGSAEEASHEVEREEVSIHDDIAATSTAVEAVDYTELKRTDDLPCATDIWVPAGLQEWYELMRQMVDLCRIEDDAEVIDSDDLGQLLDAFTGIENAEPPTKEPGYLGHCIALQYEEHRGVQIAMGLLWIWAYNPASDAQPVTIRVLSKSLNGLVSDYKERMQHCSLMKECLDNKDGQKAAQRCTAALALQGDTNKPSTAAVRAGVDGASATERPSPPAVRGINPIGSAGDATARSKAARLTSLLCAGRTEAKVATEPQQPSSSSAGASTTLSVPPASTRSVDPRLRELRATSTARPAQLPTRSTKGPTPIPAESGNSEASSVRRAAEETRHRTAARRLKHKQKETERAARKQKMEKKYGPLGPQWYADMRKNSKAQKVEGRQKSSQPKKKRSRKSNPYIDDIAQGSGHNDHESEGKERSDQQSGDGSSVESSGHESTAEDTDRGATAKVSEKRPRKRQDQRKDKRQNDSEDDGEAEYTELGLRDREDGLNSPAPEFDSQASVDEAGGGERKVATGVAAGALDGSGVQNSSEAAKAAGRSMRELIEQTGALDIAGNDASSHSLDTIQERKSSRSVQPRTTMDAIPEREEDRSSPSQDEDGDGLQTGEAMDGTDDFVASEAEEDNEDDNQEESQARFVLELLADDPDLPPRVDAPTKRRGGKQTSAAPLKRLRREASSGHNDEQEGLDESEASEV